MTVEGVVENIIFRNDENGYTVLLVNTGKAVFTVVGNIAHINKGENIRCNVTEYDNEMYGTQYKLDSYEIVMPSDADAIEKYLSTPDFKGVGKATVKRIVEFFGEDTIKVILDTPEKLYGIKGITVAKVDILREKLLEKKDEIDIILALEKYKLGNKVIRNIIDVYGSDTLKVIEENPYQMALKVDGVGFVICDNIAKYNGYDKDSEKRVAAGLLYVLENAHAEGNIYVKKEDLINATKELLSLNIDYDFNDIFYNLQMDLRITVQSIDNVELVFLKSVYNVEKKLSEKLYEKRNDITIITGGPGTGKTYNIKKYIKEAEDLGLSVELCAPTGRAAKRINEVTHHEAKTIHRLLECMGDNSGRKSYFNRNEENPLDCDMIIVDEMSMVDEHLMLSLMKAIPELAKIILVGDVDQLPSVGAGQVLKDMIESNYFKVKRLTEIHRQDEGSNIAKNAHLVNEGKIVDLNDNVEDFKFIHKSTEDKINETITILVKENIPKYFNIDISKLQVLCPSKKGNCGTENLNKILQEALNKEDYDKDEIKVGDTIFRIGDKIMQTVNNYNIPYDCKNDDGLIYDRGTGVFNGDIGEIIEIDREDSSLVARFDDRVAYYSGKDMRDLSLAYAITVHKSQGSEYDVVVMPMAYASYRLQNRKILYTAMTRAKKCICFVGAEHFFFEMVKNVNGNERNSALCSKLYIL